MKSAISSKELLWCYSSTHHWVCVEFVCFESESGNSKKAMLANFYTFWHGEGELSRLLLAGWAVD